MLSIISGSVEVIVGPVVVFGEQALLRSANMIGDELAIAVITVVGPSGLYWAQLPWWGECSEKPVRGTGAG